MVLYARCELVFFLGQRYKFEIVGQEPLMHEYKVSTEYVEILESIIDGNTDAIYRAGVLAYENGDFETAEKFFESAKKAGDSYGYLGLGILAKDSGHAVLAKEYFREGLNAGNHRCLFELGVLAARAGDLEEAERFYLQASDYDIPEAMFNLGVINSDRGELEVAKHWYLRAAAHDYAGALINLGFLAQLENENDLMNSYWIQAQNLGDAVAMFNLGQLQAGSGNLREAERLFLAAATKGNADALQALLNLERLGPEAILWLAGNGYESHVFGESDDS